MYESSIPKITLVAVLLSTLGCQDEQHETHQAVARITAQAPTLTSTATPASPTEMTPSDVEPATAETDAAPIERDRSFTPVLERSDGLAIERLVTTSAVEGREPVGAYAVFGDHDGEVYAFLEVSNATDEEQRVMVHFIGPAGQVTGGVELRIPAAAPRWRTWAYTEHAKAPGLWRVEIRDADGALLAALPFEIEPDC
ncbi:MAG TPA: DUF2914 domain-containing protein [Polyangiales bacterium]|nr:DUF2914 domain-containing protein [Polyangiales bacterium]